MATVCVTETQLMQSQVTQLVQDLRQTQADKEFIWTLWKRLQVAKPDVTAAVSVTVQREREKAESKDRKILCILKMKDDRILDYETTVTTQSAKLSSMEASKTELEDKLTIQQNENIALKDKISSLECQLLSLTSEETSKDDCNRKFIEKLETDKSDLQRRLTSILSELQAEKLERRRENERTESLQRVVSSLEHEITKKVGSFQSIISQLEASKRQIRDFDRVVSRSRRECEEKSGELEAVRRELSELWASHHELNDHATQQAELIHQLHGLQRHADTVMKSQETAYNQESSHLQQMNAELNKRHDEMMNKESDMADKLRQIKNRVKEKEGEIRELRQASTRSGQLKDHKTTHHLNLDVQNDASDVHSDLRHSDSLDSILDLHWSALGDMDHSTPNSRDPKPCRLKVDSPPPQRSRSCGEARREWARHVRSKSLGAHRKERAGPRSSIKRVDARADIKRTCGELDHTRVLLALKTKELESLKAAHTARLTRLHGLQSNYNLVKQQLKTYEGAEPPSVQKKRNKRGERAAPKQLQNETSDAVWNELSRHKKENGQLRTERVNLQEEVDVLRVKTSGDQASIHELQLDVDKYKQELEDHLALYDQERERLMSQSRDIERLSGQNEVLSATVERLKREMNSAMNECERSENDKRSLKVEMIGIKQDVSQYRITVADLKREVNRLEREIGKGEAESDKLCTSTPRSSSSGTPRESHGDDNMHGGASLQKAGLEAEGWVDISTVDEASDSTVTHTSDTLGRRIVAASRRHHPRRHTTHSTHVNSLVKKRSKTRKLKRAGKEEKSCDTRDCGVNTTNTDDSYTTHKTQHHTTAVGAKKSTIHTLPHKPPSTAKTERFKSVTAQYQRQLRLSKQRLDQLHTQLTIIKDNRAQIRKCNEELKTSNGQLKLDLTSLTLRHKNCRHTIQKLTGEVETLQARNQQAEVKLAEHSEACKNDVEAMSNTSVVEQKLEQDLKHMTHRIKASSMELSKQAIVTRTLKAENESLLKELKAFTEKLSRMERDNGQKKALLEDQRTRLRQSAQAGQTDSETISELTTQIKLKTDAADRLKTQMDSLKQRLQVVTREKKEAVERCYNLEKDHELKSCALTKSDEKVSELKSVLTDVERTAKEQMHSLADHTDEVVQSLKLRLQAAEQRLTAHEKFVKVLTMEVLYRVQSARLKHERRRIKCDELDDSLVKAQTVARDILNISQAQLDDIMTVDTDQKTRESRDHRNDQKWTKKCEKLIQKENFATPLVQVILGKLDECHNVVSHQQPS